jgi:hypothetical protein
LLKLLKFDQDDFLLPSGNNYLSLRIYCFSPDIKKKKFFNKSLSTILFRYTPKQVSTNLKKLYLISLYKNKSKKNQQQKKKTQELSTFIRHFIIGIINQNIHKSLLFMNNFYNSWFFIFMNVHNLWITHNNIYFHHIINTLIHVLRYFKD